jgi:hypothetical protein
VTNTWNRLNLTFCNSEISGKCSDKKIITRKCLDRRILKTFPAIIRKVDLSRVFLPSLPRTDALIAFYSVFWPGLTSFPFCTASESCKRGWCPSRRQRTAIRSTGKIPRCVHYYLWLLAHIWGNDRISISSYLSATINNFTQLQITARRTGPFELFSEHIRFHSDSVLLFRRWKHWKRRHSSVVWNFQTCRA